MQVTRDQGSKKFLFLFLFIFLSKDFHVNGFRNFLTQERAKIDASGEDRV